MTESSIDLIVPVRTKKEIRKTIQEKLAASLADYRTIIGEKKFDSRIKEAARLLGSEVHKSLPPKPKTPKLKKNKDEKSS